MNAPATAYHALETGVGFFDRSCRVRLEVTGPDRAKFLHNLTTNDVKRLAVNQGQEAFVTSLQGKTLGYVILLACDDRIVLRSDPAPSIPWGPHLSRNTASSTTSRSTTPSADVRATTWRGRTPKSLLRRLGATLPGANDLAHCASRIGDVSVRVVRESPAGRPGLTLIGAADSASTVAEHLHASGADLGLADGDVATFEAARIEAGTPCSGQDVKLDNLPQEVGRDARAINFVKGCYLGQETVARIDAMGHVNKHLKGLKLPPGSLLCSGCDHRSRRQERGHHHFNRRLTGLGPPTCTWLPANNPRDGGD